MTDMVNNALRRSVGKGHLPGESGVWVFILGDMAIFALFFAVYMYYRGADPVGFTASQAQLDQDVGTFNTLLLLSSSWFVVLGVRAVRLGQLRLAPTLLITAIGCGLGFGVVKYFEYGAKLAQGITISSSEFFMYYYVLTGIHLLHVLVGIGVLSLLVVHLRGVVRSRGEREPNWPLIEGGACYWHMVDLLWIVLFPLLYLVGQ